MGTSIRMLLVGLGVVFLARYFWGGGEGDKHSNRVTGSSSPSEIQVNWGYSYGTILMVSNVQKHGTTSVVIGVNGIKIVVRGEGAGSYADWLKILGLEIRKEVARAKREVEREVARAKEWLFG